MRKILGVVMILGLATLVACGGGGSSGGGGSAAEQAAETSATSFVGELSGCIDNAQAPAQMLAEGEEFDPVACERDATVELAIDVEKETLTCTCTGGGTIAVDTDTLAVDVDNCISADNLTYDGTMATDATFSSFTIDMSSFGECTNVETTQAIQVTETTCSGTLTGTCAGTTVTCTLGNPSAAGEDCTYNCS